MDILAQIIKEKRKEVAEAKRAMPMAQLEAAPGFLRNCISLKSTLKHLGKPGIIAEFKRKSPSKGIINQNALAAKVTSGYMENGAAALSVLTEKTFFEGSFDDFSLAREANPLAPMLRKDFMFDEYQLYEAKALGADVILLIAAVLSGKEITALGKKSRELGMEVLLEVHDARELAEAPLDFVDAVGVNNRNLRTFETRVETSFSLAQNIPNDIAKISESGLSDAGTIARLYAVGFSGFLIGEAFMQNPDPAKSLGKLHEEIVAASTLEPNKIASV